MNNFLMAIQAIISKNYKLLYKNNKIRSIKKSETFFMKLETNILKITKHSILGEIMIYFDMKYRLMIRKC